VQSIPWEHSITQNLCFYRSKCTYILNNVDTSTIFPTADIENSFFSIIIDESTDISVNKFLGIIIIYFSESQNQIVMTFLDMPQLFNFSASTIVEIIKKIFLIGTDNVICDD